MMDLLPWLTQLDADMLTVRRWYLCPHFFILGQEGSLLSSNKIPSYYQNKISGVPGGHIVRIINLITLNFFIGIKWKLVVGKQTFFVTYMRKLATSYPGFMGDSIWIHCYTVQFIWAYTNNNCLRLFISLKEGISWEIQRARPPSKST